MQTPCHLDGGVGVGRACVDFFHCFIGYGGGCGDGSGCDMLLLLDFVIRVSVWCR